MLLQQQGKLEALLQYWEECLVSTFVLACAIDAYYLTKRMTSK